VALFTSEELTALIDAGKAAYLRLMAGAEVESFTSPTGQSYTFRDASKLLAMLHDLDRQRDELAGERGLFRQVQVIR
jgi:hypothetical protein